MSKLYDYYLTLKSRETQPDKTLFLFKSGLFFIFLDSDAQIVSQLLNLKLTHLTENVLKCGFPTSSLDKYLSILNNTNYTYKIINTSQNIAYSIEDYCLDSKIQNLIDEINNIDTDMLSIKEAYSFIDHLKSIVKGETKNV